MKHAKLNQRRITTDATKPLAQRENEVKCPYCGELQKNGSALVRHVEKIHTQQNNKIEDQAFMTYKKLYEIQINKK